MDIWWSEYATLRDLAHSMATIVWGCVKMLHSKIVQFLLFCLWNQNKFGAKSCCKMDLSFNVIITNSPTISSCFHVWKAFSLWLEDPITVVQSCIIDNIKKHACVWVLSNMPSSLYFSTHGKKCHNYTLTYSNKLHWNWLK